MPQNSRVMISVAKLNDRCFCCFTDAMLVPLSELHQHGVSIQSSINFGEIVCRIMNNGIDLNLNDVFSRSIIYNIPDSWINLLSGCDFYFPCKPPIENTSRKRVFGTIRECFQKYGVICHSLIHWRLRYFHLLYDIAVIWRKTIKHAFSMFYFSNFYMFTGAINLMGCWENTSVNNC